MKNNLLSLRFALALVIVLLIVLGSVRVRIDDYVNSVLDRQANQQGQRESLRDTGWWWRFQREGMFLQKPVQTLGILVSGTERGSDHSARVFERGKPRIQWYGTLDRNPLQTFSSPVDLMFITGIVMSLLVLVLSFDAIAGERELGTLKLLLSFPVPRSTLLFAKWIGGMVTLSVPFVVSYLCVAIWILLSPRVTFTAQDWTACLLIGVASLLYIAWMFSAALLVSCWFRRAATAMYMLLFMWVAVVLVLPNISPYLAAGLVPVESEQAVNSKIIQVQQELRTEERERLRAIEQKYGTRRWWRHEKAWNEGVDVVTAIHKTLRAKTRAIVDDREAQLNRQLDIARNIGRLSPFVSYANMVTALAWTGPEFGQHVLRAMREFEDQLRRITTEGMKSDQGFAIEEIPVFRYSAPPVARRFVLAYLDWILLISGTAVLFLGAYVSFVTRGIH